MLEGCSKWPAIPQAGAACRHRQHARPSARVRPDCETEMREPLLSCTLARRQMLDVMPTSKPVLH
jgi:hypothetical protein